MASGTWSSMLERESGGTADEYFYRRFEISDLLIEKAISMKNETITLTNSVCS